MSHLEQLVVTKGVQNVANNPLVLVLGDIKNNLSWGLLTVHYIIDKMIDSSRYEHVICFTSKPSSCRNYLSESCKYSEIDISNPLLSLDEIYNLIHASIKSKALKSGIHEIKGLNNEIESIGVIFDGLSDLMLKHGNRTVIALLKRINNISFDISLKMCIITCIQSTLHSSNSLHQIKQYFSTIVIAKQSNLRSDKRTSTNEEGNDGQGDAVAETKTIRSNQGKTYEEIDLFGYNNIESKLTLILKTKSCYAKSASKDKKEDELSDNIFTSASAISLIKPMSSKSAEEDRNHDHSHSHQEHHPLMLSFDSTDPEFDDEDLDDDLDL